MPSDRKFARRAAVTSAACSALLIVASPVASAAPPFDSQGYVDSTARCTAPSTAVVFGSTASSRVAICRNSDGDYQYRGVRVRDGAKLITSASRSSDGAFTADNDGIEYTVTSNALIISTGARVIRDEKMLDFHRPGATRQTTAPTAPTTSTAPTPSPAPRTTPTATATPTTPLPPPLPAEVGGS
ncbi:MAG: hypothetical protein K0U76_12845 [Actinomycetia bacterium]|nr:hypothetical protein [Actinomycetes bacterium]MCH9702241.1 hypothetical protein [Actinomycetes bacterium]MCH9760980.1 hypothetical protein [Actinomycetes bacterium]